MQKWQRAFTKGTTVVASSTSFLSLFFFLREFFKICLCIPLDTFWQGLVIISCYSHEIWNKLSKRSRWTPFWVSDLKAVPNERHCLLSCGFVCRVRKLAVPSHEENEKRFRYARVFTAFFFSRQTKGLLRRLSAIKFISPCRASHQHSIILLQWKNKRTYI